MTETASMLPELVEKTREWLGEDGRAFFKKCLEEHGKIDAVYEEGRIPHAVHFREGMSVRNFLRGTGLCDHWTDHDFDNSWVDIVRRALYAKV